MHNLHFQTEQKLSAPPMTALMIQLCFYFFHLSDRVDTILQQCIIVSENILSRTGMPTIREHYQLSSGHPPCGLREIATAIDAQLSSDLEPPQPESYSLR